MSKRILYIVPHRFNRSPGQRFRCEHFIPHLKEHGYEITYSNLLSKWDDYYFYKKGSYFFKGIILIKSILKRFFDVFRARKYDVIFIYRESIMIGTTFFERLLVKTNIPIIYDFDDSIWLPDTSDGNSNLAWLKKPEKTNRIIELAQITFVGNSYLAEYAMQFSNNVYVIPTTIDTNYHIPKADKVEKDVVTIGWTGTITTQKHFAIIENVLQKIYVKYKDKVEFMLISNGDYSTDKFPITTVLWNAQTEIEQLQKIDIGIMPLPDDEWSKGKCGFKGLQYMSLEIPTILSPVGVNTKIIEHGVNGFLAHNEQEWFEILCKLIDDKNLRETIGTKGRQKIIESYSVESQKGLYLSLVEDISDKGFEE